MLGSSVVRICFVLLVACAAPVAVTPAAPSPAPTAAEILARVGDAYAHASTYADRGESSFRLTLGAIHRERHLTFATAFRRASALRFAVQEDGAPTLELSFDGRVALTREHGNRAVDRQPLAAVLDQAARASDRVAGIALLQLGLTRRTWLATLAIATAAPEELRGHPCWRLTGTRRGGGRVELWVDRASALIRQVVEVQHDDATERTPVYDSERTFRFEPISNGELTADQLAPIELTGATVVDHEPALWIGVALAPDSMHVLRVFDGTPAAAAGLAPGDEILAVDGRAVATIRAFRDEVGRYRAGQQLPFTVRRNQDTRVVAMAISERPELDDLATSQLVGKPAPAFSLTALDGAPVALAHLRGKVVVLDFWATWCTPCAITAPVLAALHAQHPAVAFLGISDEDEAPIRAHLASHPSAYPIARDSDASVSRAYLVSGIPMFIVIDRTGVVRFVGLGIDGAEQLAAELAKLP